MVHAQFKLIPKATDTHSQYGTHTVQANTYGYRNTFSKGTCAVQADT